MCGSKQKGGPLWLWVQPLPPPPAEAQERGFLGKAGVLTLSNLVGAQPPFIWILLWSRWAVPQQPQAAGRGLETRGPYLLSPAGLLEPR